MGEVNVAWKEITPEDADLLVSIGVEIEYRHDSGMTEWERWPYYHEVWLPSNYYNAPPEGGTYFRVQIESDNDHE